MRRSASLLGLVLVAAGGFVVLLVARLGDYPADAGPAVAALAHGSLRRAAAVPFLMGPFSIVLRAPFVWVADRLGAGDLGVYRAGIVPCLAAAAVLGVALVRRSRSNWAPLVAALAVLTPASVAAASNGHPEELLGGALCVAAVLLAHGRRPVWAGIALGLAIATKQWALIAVVPTLLAAPAPSRVRVALVGAAAALAFYTPFIAQDPHAFMAATRNEAHVESAATPETIWLAVASDRHVNVAGSPTLTYHAVPKWVPPVSHALIVLAALPFALLLWRRRLQASQALALLALLFLVRCVFDPVDQDYFHVPFLLALLATEVTAGAFPCVTLFAVGGLWLNFGVLHGTASPWLSAAVYLGWTAVVGAFLGGRIFGVRLFRGIELPALVRRAPRSLEV
ncbi:MAG TPA: glycosyltransferase 87 family protein [Gaiellaceae bacterium]|nr:glycosyltransferase 87 family protein [Gaiellaceae bacterium]